MSLARVPFFINSLFAVLLLVLPSLLMAQSIQVSDFSFDEMDITANTSGTEVVDPNNGKKCALIKVHTTQKGFTFDVGMLGVTKVVEQDSSHPTEIWVYVPQGVKRLSVMHPQLGELRDYDLGRTLQSSKTYHLTLQTGTVQTVINPKLQKQFAVFTLVPSNASLEVDGEAWEVNAQGQAARQLSFGTYQYRATAPRYKPTNGQFTVGKDKYTETITLQPNFSIITFQAPEGAEVWVDGERRGTGTCNVELTAGEYQVECRMESHLSTAKVVTVETANQPQTIQLDTPRPIYGLLTVNSSPIGAQVMVDGKFVGETPLSLDNVLIGNRQVAVSLSGYTAPSAKTILVSQEQSASVDFGLTKSVEAESHPDPQQTIASSASVPTAEAVDLGLSVKWANMNVGASKPEDYGDYFAWGETNPKTNYIWETYKWCNGSKKTMTKYCNKAKYGTVDNETRLDASDDAAAFHWGGTWRMPTQEEWEELIKKCKWKWTSQGGVNGYKVTGPNGNSIFLPAAGYCSDMSLHDDSFGGGYWTSSLSASGADCASGLGFLIGDHFTNNFYRYLGRSIRPVLFSLSQFFH